MQPTRHRFSLFCVVCLVIVEISDQASWIRHQFCGTVKVEKHWATLPRNYCMQPCYAIYAMSNHEVQRLHGQRCTPRLHGKVAPCLSAFTFRLLLLATPFCELDCNFQQPPESLAPFGIIWAQLRVSVRLLVTILACFRGALYWSPWCRGSAARKALRTGRCSVCTQGRHHFLEKLRPNPHLGDWCWQICLSEW